MVRECQWISYAFIISVKYAFKGLEVLTVKATCHPTLNELVISAPC